MSHLRHSSTIRQSELDKLGLTSATRNDRAALPHCREAYQSVLRSSPAQPPEATTLRSAPCASVVDRKEPASVTAVPPPPVATENPSRSMGTGTFQVVLPSKLT